MATNDRRTFLKNSLKSCFLTSAALATLPKVAFAKDCKGDAAAKSFRYVDSYDEALKADTKTKKALYTQAELDGILKRANPAKLKKASEMACDNCVLFQPGNKCAIIPSCQVKAKGFCQQWMGKPKA